MKGEMKIEHEEEVECGDGSGGGDAVARIARASDKHADEAKGRQSAEDEP